jgi:hypothetical protein
LFLPTKTYVLWNSTCNPCFSTFDQLIFAFHGFKTVFFCYSLKLNFISFLNIVFRQKLSTTWLVSIISFLIMNLCQIGLLLSLPVHTYLFTCETGYWSIFSLCETANWFEISSLLEKILLKQVRWCLTFVGLYHNVLSGKTFC